MDWLEARWALSYISAEGVGRGQFEARDAEDAAYRNAQRQLTGRG